MKKKEIARLICDLVESRDWESWKGAGILKCTCLTKGQVTMGVRYLAEKGYIKRDPTRTGRRWWCRGKKFIFWKVLLGKPRTKLDMSSGKLRLV
jgi:hypothetical protein